MNLGQEYQGSTQLRYNSINNSGSTSYKISDVQLYEAFESKLRERRTLQPLEHGHQQQSEEIEKLKSMMVRLEIETRLKCKWCNEVYCWETAELQTSVPSDVNIVVCSLFHTWSISHILIDADLLTLFDGRRAWKACDGPIRRSLE
jgi:hypothetical protein